MIPCETVYIDLVGSYTVTDKLDNDRILLTLTFVNPATNWFEIAQILDTSSAGMQVLVTFSTAHGWHNVYAPEKLYSTVEMSSRKTSCLYSMIWS